MQRSGQTFGSSEGVLITVERKEFPRFQFKCGRDMQYIKAAMTTEDGPGS